MTDDMDRIVERLEALTGYVHGHGHECNVVVCRSEVMNALPALLSEREALRAVAEAARQVTDNWNKVGAMSDGYRALRHALDELSKSNSSSQAALPADTPGLDVELMGDVNDWLTEHFAGSDVQRRFAAEYARLTATPEEGGTTNEAIR